MIKSLIKFANHLDRKGLKKEADYLDDIIKKASDIQMALNECDNECKNCNSAKRFASCLKSCNLMISGSTTDDFGQEIFTLKHTTSGKEISSEGLLHIHLDECLDKYGNQVMMMD